jgi:hypothetical protein
MDNNEYYRQTLNLIKSCCPTNSSDTDSAEVLRTVLTVFKRIATQNFSLFEKVEQLEKNLTEMIEALN